MRRANMEFPNNFYTIQTLFTLSGSSTAIWIITSVLGDLFRSKMKKNVKKWIALILSFVFSFLGVVLIPDKNPLIWVVAFVNSFFIYFTSVGLNTITSSSNGTTRTNSTVRKTSANGNPSGIFEQWW